MPLHHGRREFLKFLGLSMTSPFLGQRIFASGSPLAPKISTISPTQEDDLILADGFSFKKLIAWKDSISEIDQFGFNCDYTAFIPLSLNSGIFWTNHEYINPLFIHGSFPEIKTKDQVHNEMYNMGGSLVEIYRESQNSTWTLKKNSPFNRRITALTKIPFANEVKVKGSSTSIGMVSNCAGGVTPWNTILTCEENYDSYHGEVDSSGKKLPGKYQWERYYDLPPEHYGWVVEVNPMTGEAKKHTSLGRFCHECATVTYDKHENLVVYSGDDTAGEFLYKFISSNKKSIDQGTLFVANLETKKWIPLDINQNEKLKRRFKNQLDVLINCREAGRLLGATPLDRPEDIEVHPITGDVYVCLSNNRKEGNNHGSILKIKESTTSPYKFESETFLAGGNDFSCPDNLTFDKSGNIWLCCDISGKRIGKGDYQKFGNNGLFYIPTSGDLAGRVFQIGSAPTDAELTGVTLSPDEKTLFMSVQHPGERSKNINELTSNWPENKKGSIPKPTVVQIKGPILG